MPLQDREHLVLETGRIPELQREAPRPATRGMSKEAVDPLKICFGGSEVRRELKQERAKLLPERPHALQKSIPGFVRVLQALEVREIARGLDHEAKGLRSLVIPRLATFDRRQAIEGVVDFDRIKTAGVEGEPLLGGQIFRIKAPAPFAVVPSRGSDVSMRHQILLWFQRRGRQPARDIPKVFDETLHLFMARLVVGRAQDR